MRIGVRKKQNKKKGRQWTQSIHSERERKRVETCKRKKTKQHVKPRKGGKFSLRDINLSYRKEKGF